VFDAADRGEIGKFEARMMIIDFVAPGLDTTILATTHMLRRDDRDRRGPAAAPQQHLAGDRGSARSAGLIGYPLFHRYNSNGWLAVTRTRRLPR
jgi:hypothetical protein